MVACGATSGGTSGGTSGASSSAAARGHGTGTVWLCRPGAAEDPCATSLTTTVVSANGDRSIEDLSAASAPKADCFYVYPTVSTQKTDNSDLAVQPAEIAVAIAQAAPFSQVCRVWAPMYRQETETDLVGPGGTINADEVAENIAYASLLSAWQDYLAHDNHGRPVVFIGHSQGAAMLIRLLARQIDPSPWLRSRMISAIILGGNVQVPSGAAVGGSFAHIPACRSTTQTGCVIAYSSFNTMPPLDSLFGRAGQGVSLQSGQEASAGMQVVCTNPAALGGGAATLDASFPADGVTIQGQRITTMWVTYPGLYTARCKSAGGATWLAVTSTNIAGDPRPLVTAVLGPAWGFHLDDVNLAMGNLVQDVASEESAYRG